MFLKSYLFEYLSTYIFFDTLKLQVSTKGQMKPEADLRALDSPKNEQTNLLFFCFPTLHGKKTNSFVFWENLRHTNLLTVSSDL